jgi:DNA-binding transcriptional LysR family regulator
MRRSDLAGLTGFVAIAGNLSFRATAARLSVMPSTLGPHDAAAGGAPVCVPHCTRRGVSSTNAGRRLLERLGR